MSDFPVQKITIYHQIEKKWVRYIKEASVRNTSVLNHSKNGENSHENAIVRIFDIEGYNSDWLIQKGDVIVNIEVEDKISSTPLTVLKEKYGKDNVYKVTSKSEPNLDDIDLEEIIHIKLGCI